MRKEELDRRCAEMKERMLSQRATPIQPKLPKATGRNSANQASGVKSAAADSVAEGDIAALNKRIAELDAENQGLRRQVAALSSRTGTKSRPTDDSVREQQHNFFKYSNIKGIEKSRLVGARPAGILEDWT